MSDALRFLASHTGMPVRIDPHVPLDRLEEDGSRTPALCWRIDGELHIHPDRVELFRRLFAEAGAS